MANQDIFHLYYAQNLPPRSVAIAQLSTPIMTPADLIDVSNNPILQGALTVETYPPANFFTAPDLNVPMQISGETSYVVGSQFFLLSDQVADDGITPYWYCHDLPVTSAAIYDLNGNGINLSEYTIRQVYRDGVLHNYLLHSLDGAPYFVKYIDPNGFPTTQLLQYMPVIQRSLYASTATTYTLTGSILEVEDSSAYWIMFTDYGGFEVLPPYGDLPNDPWYVRINYPLNPLPLEYGMQLFDPKLPYMFASWVPGVVYKNNVIQFERKDISFDGIHFPDVLVYSSDYQLKYALAGSPYRGYEYPWRQNQIIPAGIEPYSATVQTLVALDTTDIVFGFYNYAEYKILYTDLDVNPFTNPSVRNMEISFIYNPNGPVANKVIYHQVVDPLTGEQVAPAYDPLSTTGPESPQVFGYVVPGAEVSVGSYTIQDARVRGGGLIPTSQDIPQAANFWDLGYWDGKPYPIGGGLVIYLPTSIEQRFTPGQLLAKAQAIVPMGVLPVVRFYNSEGEESNA
jgi:hypothetical protein